MQSSNRRIEKRYSISLAAEVNTGEHVISASAKNLSRGGVGIELQTQLAANSLIGISLFLLEDGIEDATMATLDVQGQVIWIAPNNAGVFEAGIRFAPLPPNQVRLLEDYLEKLG